MLVFKYCILASFQKKKKILYLNIEVFKSFDGVEFVENWQGDTVRINLHFQRETS